MGCVVAAVDAATPATTAATPLREANQQRVDAAAQRVRQTLYKCDDTFRKDVELLIEIALAPVLEIFAAAQPQRESEKCATAPTWPALDPESGDFTDGWNQAIELCQQAFQKWRTGQRESEQPEQALREALREVNSLQHQMAIELDAIPAQPRVEYWTRKIEAMCVAALFPQTDSQEPR